MRKRVMILICSIFIIVIGVLIGLFLLKDKNKLNNVRLEDDFYTYINYEEFQKKDIPSNTGGWDRFSEIQLDVDVKSYFIAMDLYKNGKNKKIRDYYDTLVDFEKRDSLGIEPIKEYVDRINDVKSIKELLDLSLKYYKEGIMDFFVDFTITPDFRDSDKILLSTDTVPCFIYTDESYSQMLQLSENALYKYLKLYGYEDNEVEKTINEMDAYDRLTCQNTMSILDLQDVKKINVISTKEDLKKIYSNIDIEYYFDELGYKDINELLIIDKTYHENVNETLTDEYLDVLKKEMISNLISNNALYLTRDFYNVYQTMQNLMNGTDEIKDIEDYAFEQIKDIFSSDIEEIFVEKYFSESSKKYIENMIDEVKKQYIKNLESNSWLSEDTKNMAIRKLDNLTVRVGYPELIKNSSDLYDIKSYDEGGNALKNELSIRKIENKKDLELLYGLDKLDGWDSIPLLEVNAYYNPHDNSINFPVAISYVVNEKDSYFTNLGKIGMIISHEMSHAFDSSGSLFDEHGNMVNWWNDEDKEEYDKRAKDVAEYYSNFTNPYGVKVNGKLTLSENIADLGAIECITSIAVDKNASKKELKELYSSFASFWANEYNESISKKQIITDTHSPNNVRVNATLSSNDLFYDTYNIKYGDGMFVSKENRVKIW